MARRFRYTPPALVRRIRLRNPADAPTPETDAAGRVVSQPEWGEVVWAARRDGRPREESEIRDAVEIRSAVTVWTIRKRSNVAADVQVVSEGEVFDAIGLPIERGGPEFGRADRYLEIHTIRRS